MNSVQDVGMGCKCQKLGSIVCVCVCVCLHAYIDTYIYIKIYIN